MTNVHRTMVRKTAGNEPQVDSDLNSTIKKLEELISQINEYFHDNKIQKILEFSERPIHHKITATNPEDRQAYGIAADAASEFPYVESVLRRMADPSFKYVYYIYDTAGVLRKTFC